MTGKPDAQKGGPTAEAPLVSVVITAYNSTAVLHETLRSAAAQICPRKEIVLVDDGSQPAGAAVIDEALADFPEVVLVREANRGVPGAKNRGAHVSRGEFIAFLDHDDVWRAGLIERLLVPMRANARLGVVFCRIEHMRENGEPTGRVSRPKLRGITVGDLLVSDPACCGSSFMVRRSAFQEVGGFDEALRNGSEAPALFLRLVLGGWEIEGIDDVLVLYRNTMSGVSAKAGALLRDRLRIVEQILPHCPELGEGTRIKLALRWTELKNRLRKSLIG